jgi:hypothetical protein
MTREGPLQALLKATEAVIMEYIRTQDVARENGVFRAERADPG